ncbi:hypothetical protein LTR02_007788 [Friedmanniomyces endolithicus]|nr:hypothetical protein LTR94_008641 [Friedmanniomyces endolithicus]KAK0791210.1 hypothetical protein LTR59_008934 [Friedmanniomyces endolithicus]KAK0797471.1 hypothetical protein LTR38_008173 [Friedmanniomyces endolithicus]KAK0816315.1 hypothetical protein LTR75_003540 [Friedmanniomyces endolithicus]KAK0839291.1 hypothetical protein LTR03_011365 [Friedmanniomyces endolithicus]
MARYGICIADFAAARVRISHLAGYLGLCNCKDLENVVFANETVLGCLQRLLTIHWSNFGIVVAGQGLDRDGSVKAMEIAFEVTRMFEYLNQAFFMQSEVDADDEPSIGQFPRHSNTHQRMYLLFLREASKAIHALPEVFTGAFPDCTLQVYVGCQAKDLHRFAALYYFYKQKVTRSAEQTLKPRTVQQGLPKLPIVCSSRQGLANSLEMAARNAQAFERLSWVDVCDDNMLQRMAAAMYSPSEESEDEGRDGAVSLCTSTVFLRDSIPELSEAGQHRLMRFIASHAQVLFERVEHCNKLFTPSSDTVTKHQARVTHNEAALVAGCAEQELLDESSRKQFVAM